MIFIDNVVCGKTWILALKYFSSLQPPHIDFFQEIYLITELMQSDLHKIIVSPQHLTSDHIKVRKKAFKKRSTFFIMTCYDLYRSFFIKSYAESSIYTLQKLYTEILSLETYWSILTAFSRFVTLDWPGKIEKFASILSRKYSTLEFAKTDHPWHQTSQFIFFCFQSSNLLLISNCLMNIFCFWS